MRSLGANIRSNKNMGHRTTQRILVCAVCGIIPDDGEYMWEMNGEYWCEECCNDGHQYAPETPELEGTSELLDGIGT